MTKEDSILNRVRALLAQAEDPSATEAEAESFTAKATELMAKYGIDEALAAQRENRVDKPIDRMFTIQRPYPGPKSSLLHGVVKALGCRAVTISGTGRSKVHVFGFQSDVEMVDLLYTSLLLQASTGAARIESVRDHTYTSRTRSARSSYLIGFADAVRPRLLEAYGRAKDEAENTPGTAIVLRSRELAVDDAVNARYPKIRMIHSTARNSSGYSQGQKAGQRANLHNRPSAGGSSRPAIH